MKKHLFYTFLGIFAATALVTLLGIVNVLPVRDGHLASLVAALLVELVGAVIALFRSTDFFAEDDNPKQADAVAHVQQSHAHEIQRLTSSHTRDQQAALQQHQSDQQTIAELRQQVAQLEAQSEQQTVEHLKLKRDWINRINELSAKISQVRPIQPASGSARTRPPNATGNV